MNADPLSMLQVIGAQKHTGLEHNLEDSPTLQQIEKFSQLLKVLPSHQEEGDDKLLINDPSSVIKAQGDISKFQIDVDLVTRIVGAVSQGINKVVGMGG